MAAWRALIYLGVCVWCMGGITSVEVVDYLHNLRWISLDFTTLLTWDADTDATYTVLYSMDGGDWTESMNCIQMLHTECDMTSELKPPDRTYKADIQIEHEDMEADLDDLPHMFSTEFNPYRESNISSVKFTVEAVDESRVTINITDTLTGIHEDEKQLTIRDVLKDELKYKIGYYKAGSTGKKEHVSDSSNAEVTNLDRAETYCFIVAAYIPSRPKALQQGAWGTEQCTQTHGVPQRGLSVGAMVGIIFILLTVVIVAVSVIVLCCKCCRQRNKSLRNSQTAVPI